MSGPFICPVNELFDRFGFYIASEVYDPRTGRMLLNSNCEINEGIILALEKWGIESVLISPTITDEESPLSVKNLSEDILQARETKQILMKAFGEVVSELSGKVTLKRDGIKSVSTDTVSKVKNVIGRVIDRITENPAAMVYIGLMDEKDPYLLRHNTGVTYMALSLATRYPQIRRVMWHRKMGTGRFDAPGRFTNSGSLVPLGVACMLHDVGKVPMLDIINDDIEISHDNPIWKKIKEHPKIGHDLLFGKGLDAHSLLGIKYHHENLDGSGYPYGIEGEKIHVYGRLIRVVDSFEAAISDRPGGKAKKSPSEACEELKLMSGIHYDPYIVDHFINMVEESVEV